MPPGSKKRKAAKKKKEMETHQHSDTNSQEQGNEEKDDELTRHDEKEVQTGQEKRDILIESVGAEKAAMEESINGDGESTQKVKVLVAPIEEGTLLTPSTDLERKSSSVENFQSVKGPNEDSSGHHESSSSSSDEEPTPVKNLSEIEAGELANSISVTDPIGDSVKKVGVDEEPIPVENPSEVEMGKTGYRISVTNPIGDFAKKVTSDEERSSVENQSEVEVEKSENSISVTDPIGDSVNKVSLDKEPAPGENSSEIKVGKPVNSIPVTEPIGVFVNQVGSSTEEEIQFVEVPTKEILDLTGVTEATPVEKIEVLNVEETDSIKNSGVTQVIEVAVIENAGVGDGVNLPLAEVGETVISPSTETVNEKARDGGECHQDSENPVSLGNEEPETVSALPPVHPISLKSCCGLFELLKGSN